MLNHKCKVELHERLEDDLYQHQLWNLIKEYDKEFKPSLSKRDSVIDYDLLKDEDDIDGALPFQFYDDIKKMSFILYVVDGEIKAFSAYKKGYILNSLEHMEFDKDKAIYVAFSLVKKEYRNQGIFYIMNNLLEGYYRKKVDVIQRRVKSTNLPMLNSLTRKNSYSIGKMSKNGYGEGVHAVGLYKYLT